MQYKSYHTYYVYMIQIYTVGKNIIATTKIQKSFIFKFCDSNIRLFSIAPCKIITLNPLCILFGIIFFFFMASFLIALPTIAIAIVVALSRL